MNYFLWNLFGPASWPLWLILVAAAASLIPSPGAREVARSAALLAGLLVVVLAVLPTGFWLMQRLETEYPRPRTLPPAIDHIAVLAGGELLAASDASGALELSAHGDRVSEALALAHAYPQAMLWIVGGVSNGFSRRDVDWAADYWIRAGVEAKRVHRIAGGLDTCGNAAGIARALPGKRILLVTSGFHMPRAMACMRAASVDAVPYAVDRQTWRADTLGAAWSPRLVSNMQRSELALHEYFGLLYYRVTGRLG